MRNKFIINTFLCLSLLIFVAVGCKKDKETPDPVTPPITPADTILSLDSVRYWAYQIQGLEADSAIDKLANSFYDLLVLEPTRTEKGNTFDTKAMVTKLKNSYCSDSVKKKIVLAYIDIGEAESWRWYWNWSSSWSVPRPADWPSFIIYPDPDGWEDNYVVTYWDTAWKNIVIHGVTNSGLDFNSVIDEVIKDGFDGIYIDWVEAYEDSVIQVIATQQGKDPADEMIKFIKEMRDYALLRNPNFIIIQQNASSLLDGHPELLDEIDAIAQEAIWFDGSGGGDDWDSPDGYDEATDLSLTNEYIFNLDQYKAAGKLVFCAEYALVNATTAYNRAYAKGYIPYCTRRSLQRLSTTPPPR